jgi:hypothetical protein
VRGHRSQNEARDDNFLEPRIVLSSACAPRALKRNLQNALRSAAVTSPRAVKRNILARSKLPVADTTERIVDLNLSDANKAARRDPVKRASAASASM